MIGYATRLDRNRLLVKTEYDEDVVQRLKALPRASWRKDQRGWICSSEPGALDGAVDILEDLGVELYPDVIDLLRDRAVESDAVSSAAVARAADRAAAFGQELWPWQPRGVGFLATRQSALLAWEMGTGKTIVALSALPTECAALVVCPATPKWNWHKEIRKWRPDMRVHVCEGRDSFRYPEMGEIVVINYDILPQAKRVKRRLTIEAETPDYPVHVILDEIRKTKNGGTNRTASCRAIMRAVRAAGGTTWGLDGTPISNSPNELWSILQGLGVADLAFGGYPTFRRVMGWFDDPMGWGYWRKPLPESRKMLARVMDVQELPADWGEPIVEYLEVDITMSAKQRAEGEALLQDWRDAAGDRKSVAWSKIAAYRKVLAEKKAAAMRPYFDSLEEEKAPAVVFCCHRQPVLDLGRRKDWTFIIGGDVALKERFRRIEDFQSGRFKGMALTIRSGGEAITLTRSHKVVFIDCDYDPAWNKQALYRVHRMGQTKRVQVVIAVARGTIDYDVLEINDTKQRMIDACMPSRKKKPPPPKKPGRKKPPPPKKPTLPPR